MSIRLTPPPPGVRTQEACAPALAAIAEPVEPDALARSHSFDATVDLSELDDRQRPGPSWCARGDQLSRAHLVVLSKRMVHPERRILIAIHLVDDRPAILFGRVESCSYQADGLHRIRIEFQPVPNNEAIRDWITEAQRRSPWAT